MNDQDGSSGPETPVFNPATMRDPEAWFPGNDAAALVVHIDHAYRDMVRLAAVRESQTDQYTRKLLLKYVLIELREMLPLVDRLQTLAMQAPVVDPGDASAWRSLTPDESRQAKTVFRQFNREKNRLEGKLVEIRNRIGAHRSVDPWEDVIRSWDELEPELMQPLLDAVPPLFNFVRELDIYEWNRRPVPDAVEIWGGRISF